MTVEKFDYTGLYTIVLTEPVRNQFATISRILGDCWQLHITNVVLLVEIAVQRKTAIYTYFPFTRFHCETVSPVIINYFMADDTFFYPNSPLFPPKTHNMYKCPIYVASCENVPFMMFSTLADGSFYFDGIDGITLRVLSQRLNFKPIILIPPNDEYGGDIFKNGTMTGSMRLVSVPFSDAISSEDSTFKFHRCNAKR